MATQTKTHQAQNCELEAKILLDLPVNSSPLRVFESNIRLNDLVTLFVTKQTSALNKMAGYWEQRQKKFVLSWV